MLLIWIENHPNLLIFFLFLTAFGESIAIIGLAVPGIAILFALGSLAGKAEISVPFIIFITATGAFLGDTISFFIGKKLKHRIHTLPILRSQPQWLKRGTDFFHKYGIFSIIAGRFIGPLRPFIPLLAGSFNMRTPLFLGVGFFSGLAWAPFYILPGYWAGQHLNPELNLTAWIFVVFASLTLVEGIKYLYSETPFPSSSRNPMICCLISIIILGLIASKVTGWSMPIDQWILHHSLKLRTTTADQIFLAISLSADFPVIGFIFLFITNHAINYSKNLQSTKFQPGGFRFFFFISLFLSTSNYLAFKYGLDPPRPDMLVKSLDTNAFPSGHSFFSILAATCLLFLTPIPPRLLILWAVLVGFSRIYFQLHWLTDVLTGLGLGMMSILFIRLKFNKLSHSKLQPDPYINTYKWIWVFGILLFYSLYANHKWSSQIVDYQIRPAILIKNNIENAHEIIISQ